MCPSLLGGRVPIASQTPTYPLTIKRYSHQSYGGDNNPQGNQPASRKSRELEHPGTSTLGTLSIQITFELIWIININQVLHHQT